jgi:hypothetical protein
MIVTIGTLERQRKLDTFDWCQEILPRPEIHRKLKCLSILEDEENGGSMVIGTNYGDVLVSTIGRAV